MCDFLFLIEKINKITMMKPRGMGARVSQGRLLLHGLLCWPVGTSTGMPLSREHSLPSGAGGCQVRSLPGAMFLSGNGLGLLSPHRKQGHGAHSLGLLRLTCLSLPQRATQTSGEPLYTAPVFACGEGQTGSGKADWSRCTC